MHKFIKTVYLWVGLFTACNLITVVTSFESQPFMIETLYQLPVAWLLQAPLILIVTAGHCGINFLISVLRIKSKVPCFLFSFLLSILFMGSYVASQMMYAEIHSFIAWDAFRVALDNTIQILPDIGRSNTAELTLISFVSIGISIGYIKRYEEITPIRSVRIFFTGLTLSLVLSAGSFLWVYSGDGKNQSRVRKELLPTTFLTLSFIDGMLPHRELEPSALADLTLASAISLEQYHEANPIRTPYNIFFIMLESVSWDHFGFTGYYRKNITPNLNNLAMDSLIFPRTYAPANHSNYAQTSTHSSQYPLRRKQLDRFENVDYPKTLLFDTLSQAGYQTAFISAQNEDWQGMKSFTQAHTEMQHYVHSKNELGNNIGIESKIDDALVRTRAVEFIDEQAQHKPLFMYLNFQASHFPYDIPEHADSPYQPCSTDHFKYKFFHYDQNHLDNVINKYDNALHYVDVQIGAFIDYLKLKGLYDESLIVVAADHGEAFYKCGYPTHGTALFEDQMRTVTLFKTPKSNLIGTRTDPISLIDINPTILEILNVENHPNFQGQQILKNPRKNPIYIMSHGIIKSLGIIDYPWKYFTSEKDGEWVINLEKDPDETTNLMNQHPLIQKRLQQQLDRYQQRQMYYYNVLSEKDRKQFYPPKH